METYHKIQTLFKRDMDGSLTGKKGKMIEGEWTTPELEYLADKEWEFTEKVDGTNIRVNLKRLTDNETFMVVDYAGRTDNAVIPKPLLEHLEEVFPTFPNYRRELSNPSYTERYVELVDWMVTADLTDVILFGEGYGPKIQGGGKYRSDHSFVLFDVKIGDFYLSRENVNDIASKLGIESVPVIGRGTLWDAIEMVNPVKVIGHTMDMGGYVSEEFDEPLKSQWGDFEAEGIVARPVVDLFNRKGERIITKIKAVDFR